MNPAIEITTALARFAERCRAARWFGALFHVSVCQDIAADVVSERIDRERRLKKQIARAQCPKSPGGRNITPCEIAAAIAEADHAVNLLTQSEAARFINGK